MQKNNKTKPNNHIWLKKGLILLILSFYVQASFAQKTLEKSIQSRADKIIIEFDQIDKIELITGQEKDKITVSSNSEENGSPNFILHETKGVVFIKSTKIAFDDGDKINTDKQCATQPFFSTYRIVIPKNKQVEITFSKGNFNANQFEGDLKLKLDDGIVKMEQLRGDVLLYIDVGKAIFSNLENVKVDANSTLYKVDSDFLVNKFNKTKVKGILGGPKYNLTVYATFANVTLRAAKN